MASYDNNRHKQEADKSALAMKKRLQHSNDDDSSSELEAETGKETEERSPWRSR
jgi:hypothetical protein